MPLVQMAEALMYICKIKNNMIMDDKIFTFYKEALKRGLSGKYKRQWKSALSDKEKLISLSLTKKGILFLIKAVNEGWSPEIDYLKKEFENYINGNYISLIHEGIGKYAGELFMLDDDPVITICTDVSNIIHCDKDVYIISNNHTSYISNDSVTKMIIKCACNEIRINMFDRSKLILEEVPDKTKVFICKYSDKCTVIKKDKCKGAVSEMIKKLGDYE